MKKRQSSEEHKQPPLKKLKQEACHGRVISQYGSTWVGIPNKTQPPRQVLQNSFFFIVRFMMARMTNTNKPASKPLVQQSLSEQKPLIIFSDNKRSCMDLRNQILLECPADWVERQNRCHSWGAHSTASCSIGVGLFNR